MPDDLSDVISHYQQRYREEDRISVGFAQLELVRTREILSRFLPAAPASIIDIGGATGVHARWLAEAGYRVHIVDLTPRHVEQAVADLSTRGVTAEVGDARDLPADDASYDAALLLGPMYHLVERDDRITALRETQRVTRPGGLVAVAAINRFASLFDGLARGFIFDRDFRKIMQGDLADGRHVNVTGRQQYFTTAYFHRADDLRDEAIESGLEVEGVFGVEGLPGWLAQLGDRWDNDDDRHVILDAARAVESEPSLMGLSAHLLLIGRRGS